MAKSYVLKALKILGLEDIKKLSQILKIKSSAVKKAAGEELIFWNEASDETMETSPEPIKTNNVLEFKKSPTDKVNSTEDSPEKEVESENDPASVLLLWQHEMAKDNLNQVQKKDAMAGYARANEMYVVKTTSAEGKDKMRFASTKGVLIDKKQA